MGQTKPYREPLQEELVEGLLGDLDPNTRVGHSSHLTALRAAQTVLAEAVEKTNAYLASNPVAAIVAREAARAIGRRGGAHIVVDSSGAVMLEVRYGKEVPEEVLSPPAGRKTWTSGLPPISELRERAAVLGLDPAPFGRKRRALLEAIEQFRTAGEEPKPPKSKGMTKTAPAIGPVTVLNPDPNKEAEGAPPDPSPDLRVVEEPPPEPEEPVAEVGGTEELPLEPEESVAEEDDEGPEELGTPDLQLLMQQAEDEDDDFDMDDFLDG